MNLTIPTQILTNQTRSKPPGLVYIVFGGDDLGGELRDDDGNVVVEEGFIDLDTLAAFKNGFVISGDETDAQIRLLCFRGWRCRWGWI